MNELLELKEELAELRKKLVESEARAWRCESAVRAFRHSMDSNKPFPSLEKITALIGESPALALEEHLKPLVEALEFISCRKTARGLGFAIICGHYEYQATKALNLFKRNSI